MIPKDGINLKYLKAAFLRRFWYIVVPFFVVSITTVGYCIKAPRLYKSSTLILVQPQEVPTDYVKSTVTSNIRSRLNTITEQIMSRSKIQAIIEKYNLYPEIRMAEGMDSAVAKMRGNIYVNFSVHSTLKERSGFDSPPAFEVSFVGKHPAKVRDVTAELANIFLDENLKIREQQAAGTSVFLERELERMKEELRRKEELVRQFKEEYMGQLPEQMENNYRILDHLQKQLDSLNANSQQTEDRKVLLQTQLGRLEALQVGPEAGSDGAGTPVDLSQFSLDELRQQLHSLRSRYSDKHPDVIRLSATIAKLEKDQDAMVDDTDSERTMVTVGTSQAQRLAMAQREDLLTQLKLIDKELITLTKEKKKVDKQISLYRKRIEGGPAIEQKFVDLRRGYREASENYQSLLEKKLQAELAQNLERTRKGEQFSIQDHANLPRRPIKPDLPKTLPIGLILALACGLGLGYVREHLDTAFWSSKDLEGIVDLPVLVSIPVVNTKKERRWNMLKRAAAAGVLVSMASVLFYALFLLWKMDPTAFRFPLG